MPTLRFGNMIYKHMTRFLILIAALTASVSGQAKSFSADAVQMRNGQFSHAKMFWADGNVRFEYLEDGVSIAQIYNLKKKKVIWLDIESKRYIENKLSPERPIDPMLKETKTSSNPCDLIETAECTRLKEVYVDDRATVKWLITQQLKGVDQHVFQWIDKKYNVVVRQENPDGSTIVVKIEDNQELNGRKVRKLSIAIESKSQRSNGVQWYDDELNIIVRQHYQNGAEDELRNIKIEKFGKDKFSIPGDYKSFDVKELASETNASQINSVTNPANN
jgi:hypothetical protein